MNVRDADPATQAPRTARTGRLALGMLLVHVLVVTLLTAFLTLTLFVGEVADANIGGGAAMLALAGLGMPWSLLYFFGVIPEERDFGETSLFIIFALCNVLIHGLLTLWLDRRRSRAPSVLQEAAK